MKKLLIDYQGRFIRTVLLEDGEPVDIVIEEKCCRSMLGHIYTGIVKNILPSRFAFVDIGAAQNAFLNLNDKKEKRLWENDAVALKQGQTVLVQVVKDPTGEKGAAVSTQLNFTGKLCVVYPTEPGRHEIGVSQKISSQQERERLKKIAGEAIEPGFGMIVRTDAAHVAQEALTQEILSLTSLFKRYTEVGAYLKPPALVYGENTVMRELMTADMDAVVLNDAKELPAIREAAARYMGGFDNVILHTEPVPLFDEYFVESKIKKALNKRVWLDCGGFLIVEQTEACAIIDVNTGKFRGKKNLRETIRKTNLEAAAEVARQIRLRNLSGMIIIDFIDMESREDIRMLYDVFSEALKKDRIRTNIVGMTELGLMQLTRKKTREPLSRILMTACAACGGTGHVPK